MTSFDALPSGSSRTASRRRFPVTCRPAWTIMWAEIPVVVAGRLQDDGADVIGAAGIPALIAVELLPADQRRLRLSLSPTSLPSHCL